MSHAATSAIFYPTFTEGDPNIYAQIDVVVAGSDVLGGRQYTGLLFEVDPTNDTPNTLKTKVGDAVRGWASEQCHNSTGGVGVTIGPNDVLMGDFQKG